MLQTVLIFSQLPTFENFAMDSSLLHINICGSINIVLGVVSIALQVSQNKHILSQLFSTQRHHFRAQSYITHVYVDYYEKIGAGIWCGLIFLLTGIVAVIAVCRVKRWVPRNANPRIFFKKKSLNHFRQPIAATWICILCLSFLSIIFGAVQIGISTRGIQFYRPTAVLCSSLPPTPSFAFPGTGAGPATLPQVFPPTGTGAVPGSVGGIPGLVVPDPCKAFRQHLAHPVKVHWRSWNHSSIFRSNRQTGEKSCGPRRDAHNECHYLHSGRHSPVLEGKTSEPAVACFTKYGVKWTLSSSTVTPSL